LVTSARPGEGKTTIAWHLAEAAAQNAKVALVEADMRNPVIAERQRLPSAPGLAEHLTQQVRLADIIKKSDSGFDVIVAGTVPPNPSELMESQAMRIVFAALNKQYDFIVVDTPATAVVSDAFPLVTQVSGVIVVCRLDGTTRDSAAGLREQLDRLGAPLLGVVANRVKRRPWRRYGEYFDYDYYARKAPAETNGGREPVRTRT
jgi:capsular exopolysaccharide synthesis family protein